MGAELPIVYYNDFTVTADENIRVYWSCFKQVCLWVHVGGTPTGTNPTLDVKIQHKAPREDADWVDITGASITQLTAAGTQFILLEQNELLSEDLRIVVDIGGTDTPTFPGTDMSAMAVT